MKKYVLIFFIYYSFFFCFSQESKTITWKGSQNYTYNNSSKRLLDFTNSVFDPKINFTIREEAIRDPKLVGISSVPTDLRMISNNNRKMSFCGKQRASKRTNETDEHNNFSSLRNRLFGQLYLDYTRACNVVLQGS